MFLYKNEVLLTFISTLNKLRQFLYTVFERSLNFVVLFGKIYSSFKVFFKQLCFLFLKKPVRTILVC